MVAQQRPVSVRWAMVLLGLLGLLELGVKAQGGPSVTVNTDDRPPATVREGFPSLVSRLGWLLRWAGWDEARCE